MKSKLGLYVQTLEGLDVPAYVASSLPRVILSMDHNPDVWRLVKGISPNTIIIGRHYVDDANQFYDNPVVRAQDFFQSMRPEAEKMRGIYDLWMAFNEPAVFNAQQAINVSDFYVEWGRLMREANLRSGAYSWSVGNPGLELWPYLLPGLRACDFHIKHEYASPTMQTDRDWLCLRYRKDYAKIPVADHRPLIIAECGIDGGTSDKPQHGWQKFCNEAEYLAQLKWYDEELQRDPYVVGACIFEMNPWGVDGSFGMAQCTSIRDYISSGGDAPVYVPPEPTEPPIVITPPTPIGWCPFAEKKTIGVNFTVGRGGQKPDSVVLHVAQGTLAGAQAHFNNPVSGASAHFIIGQDGEIWQFVSIYDTAWSNGLRYDNENKRWICPHGKTVSPTWKGLKQGVNPNSHTISIEHEGMSVDVWTAAMYNSNVKLMKWIAEETGIIYNDVTLTGHYAIDPADRANCPGPHVDYAKLAFDSNKSMAADPFVEFDPRLVPMNVTIQGAIVKPGEWYWKIVKVLYEPPGDGEGQSHGNHNAYITVLDKYGVPMMGVDTYHDWTGRDPNDIPTPRPTDGNGEAVHDLYPGPVGWRPENGPGPDTVWAGDPNLRGKNPSGIKGDRLAGIGLPFPNLHVNYRITYKKVLAHGTEIANSPESAAQIAALLYKPKMAINTDAAIYKYAMRKGLGHPQTDEFPFEYQGQAYIGQEWTGGIVYVKKGEWDNCAHVKKLK